MSSARFVVTMLLFGCAVHCPSIRGICDGLMAKVAQVGRRACGVGGLLATGRAANTMAHGHAWTGAVHFCLREGWAPTLVWCPQTCLL